jgi:glycosyltransferase involved in cell wall biosynthesis
VTGDAARCYHHGPAAIRSHYEAGSATHRYMDHSFVIPVYGAAPHLAALIESLQVQTSLRSEILLSSSTPSPELAAIAKRLGLPLHINPQRIDIAADWNFALARAETQFVTLAHQDDIFAPGYVVQMNSALRRNPAGLLAFCDYSEHTPLGARPVNVNLRIKRALRRRAFGARECITETRDKLRLLSLGNPVCCPSVMFNRRYLDNFAFPGGFKTNLDWMAWLELARRPGGFVYVRECLLSKGVHTDSETSATIANRAREREDREIFDTLWPRPVAALLATLYKFGYRANRSQQAAPPSRAPERQD